MGNWFEEIFLSWGFGWVMSKFLPYVCMLLLALIVFWLIRKRIQRRGISFLVLFLLLVAPAGIYFTMHPIYASDLTNNGVVHESFKSVDKKERAIFVYAIPGCPFCRESVALMDKFRERNQHVVVSYVIVDGSPQDVMSYQKLSKHGIRFIAAKDDELQDRGKLVSGRYPTFMIARTGKIETWTNNEIGAIVLDDWEEEFTKK